MNTEPLHSAWSGYRGLPLRWQLGLAGVVALLIVGINAIAGGVVAHYKDRRFDAAQTQAAQDRQTLQGERDRAIATAVAAEARAMELEAQLTRDRTDDQAAARAVVTADAAVERISHETDQDVARVLADDASTPDERRARIRAILRRQAQP